MSNAFRFLALPGGLAVTIIPVHRSISCFPKAHAGICAKASRRSAVDIVNQIIRRSGNRVPPLTVEALGDATPKRPREAAALLGLVRPRPAALDDGRHSRRRVRRHRLFPDFSPAAKGAGRSGLRRQSRASGLTSVVYLASFFGKGFTGYPDGDHRAALDDRLCAPRIAAGRCVDAAGASCGGLCGRGDGGGRADHRLYRAVCLYRYARLPVRAVPDGIARARAHFRRIVREAVCRRDWRRF